MTRRNVKTIAILIFLLLFFGLVLEQKSQIKRVQVIHSYNTDYDWVTQINQGVIREFSKRPDVLVRYHYMDLKNHTDADFKRTATSLAMRVVDEWQPDVLILFDDIAQQLVGQHYADIQANGAPRYDIVFSGVNADPMAYYADLVNVTGVLERKPLSAIKETLLVLLRAKAEKDGVTIPRPRIQFIGDLSESITAELPFYDQIDWAPMVWLPPVQVGTYDDWKAAVERASQAADMIVVTNYQQLRDGDAGPFIRPAAQVMAWTEAHAAVPVLGVGWTNAQDGAMIAVPVSPFEQGGVAAGLALKIVDGTPVPELDVVSPSQFLVHICGPAAERRGLHLPDFYEAFARATDSYYKDGC